MSINDSCPSAETLRDWALGTLPEHQADDILDHLDVCMECEQIAACVQMPQLIRNETPPDDFTGERECREFIELLTTNRSSQSSSRRDTDDLSGSQIRDYQLVRPLGRGGMGTVYLARHTRLNKPVAIKVLPEHSIGAPSAVTFFEREMQAVGLLEHPNVVRALDAGDVDGLYFLTMELLDGVNLARLTSSRRSLCIADACEIARQAAEGMQYAHDRGLIHRDIKPSNLMLARDHDQQVRLKVLDLGLAMLPESGGPETSPADQSEMVGTIEYMAPEQANGSMAVDSKADIYALGATLYRLLTGGIPFRGEKYRIQTARLAALATLDAPSIATVRKDLPAELVNLVDRMLSRDCRQRPPSMAQVAETLVPFALGADLTVLMGEIVVDVVDRETTVRWDIAAEELVDTSPSVAKTLAISRDTFDTEPRDLTSAENSLGRVRLLLFAILASSVVLALKLLGLEWPTNKQKNHENIAIRPSHQNQTGAAASDFSDVLQFPNAPLWQWGEPVVLRSPVNSEWKDDQPTISADGLTMIYSSYCKVRRSGEGDRDLWVATRPRLNSPWQGVRNLGPGINSSMKETHPTFHSQTGLLMFASNRSGSDGTDIWQVTGSLETGAWETPTNSGPNVNSPGIDDNPELSTDGRLLLFSSNRLSGGLGMDLWYCERETLDQTFSMAQIMPDTINTSFIESDPALSANQLVLIFSSDRPGGFGGKDLWASIRPTMTDEWSEPFNLGSDINTSADESHAAFLPNGKSIVFSSTRTGKNSDLWTTEPIVEERPESLTTLPVIRPSGAEPKRAILPFSPSEAFTLQQKWADYLGVPVDFENSIGMRFRLIPPGEFLMGASEREHEMAIRTAAESRPGQMNPVLELQLIESERPQHRVILTKPYYIGVFEVREKDMNAVFERQVPIEIQSPDHPVGLVSWLRAGLFCNELNKRESISDRYVVDGRSITILPMPRGYRLPTEAEWEFACRAGTDTRFPFGNDLWQCRDYSWHHAAADADVRNPPSFPVGQKAPNAFGLYDMLGNHWEWCEDADVPVRDLPEPWVNPLFDAAVPFRISRGGFVQSITMDLRSARRRSHRAHMPYTRGGFRVVIALGPDDVNPISDAISNQ